MIGMITVTSSVSGSSIVWQIMIGSLLPKRCSSMACSGCGTARFSEGLGKCGRCTAVAGGSAALFWALYVLANGLQAGVPIVWPLLGFAVLITLLFASHVIAHLSHRPAK